MSSRPLLLGGLVIAACLAGLTFGWLRPSEVLSVAATFLDSVRDFGAAGMLVFVAAQIVIAFTGLMPASLLGMVAGAAYGLATGFILVAVGTVLGSMLGFLVARSTLSGSSNRC